MHPDKSRCMVPTRRSTVFLDCNTRRCDRSITFAALAHPTSCASDLRNRSDSGCAGVSTARPDPKELRQPFSDIGFIMLPTLLGRWQTRVFLLIFVGLPISAVYAI